MLCHIAVTHLPHSHTLPLTLHTHVQAHVRVHRWDTRTLMLDILTLVRCYEVLLFISYRLGDGLFSITLILHISSLFIYPNVLLSHLSQVPPPPSLFLLFSRVWVSNCSGPQREGGMERKRERRVHESTYIYETEQEWWEVEMRRIERMCVGVCVHCGESMCGCEERDCVHVCEAQWDHWSAESAMCVLN